MTVLIVSIKNQKIMLQNVKCIIFEEKERMKCSLQKQESELSKKKKLSDHKFKVKSLNKIVCISSATLGCIGAGIEETEIGLTRGWILPADGRNNKETEDIYKWLIIAMNHE